MADEEVRVLPEGYYLDNFYLLIKSANERYADVLTESERVFIEEFQKLPLASRRLYVRLVSRKGPYFRVDALRYSEIPDVHTAIRALVRGGFAEEDGKYEVQAAINLLRVGELKSFFPEVPKSGRKAELIEWLGENCEENDIRKRIENALTVLEPLRVEAVATFMLLFFGNSRQDLSEFVITDLGVVNYESYPLDPETRPFETRNAVDAMQSYYDASEQVYELSELHEVDGLLNLGKEFSNIEFPERLRHRKDRVLNGIARQLEREELFEDAFSLYGTTKYPPSRERRARLLTSMGDCDSAAQILGEILREPLSEEELEFAKEFSRRQFRKVGEPFLDTGDQKFIYGEIRISLARVANQSVEEIALNHFTEQGYEGAWCENSLMNGLFGLVFWNIIFLPKDGAFYNQFQRGPSDLMLPDFRQRREHEFRERLQQVSIDERWRAQAADLFVTKNEIGNAFINWRRLPQVLIELALQRIPSDHLCSIFDRMSRDVRANTSGFPDLAVFPKNGQMGDYKLIEVKGPGDRVQKNQLRWMKRFAELGVPYEVLWVDYL